MADYVVEPIKPQRSLADIISDAVEAGLTDDEIRSAVAKRRTAAMPAGHGRGDELFQPDPSPADVKTVGRRLPKQDITEAGDVDLGKLGLGPAAAGSNLVAGTSYRGIPTDGSGSVASMHLRDDAPGISAPAANGPAEARGFLRFAAGGVGGMAAGGAARALGAPGAVQNVAGGAAAGAAPSAMQGDAPGEIAKNAAIGASVPTVGALLERGGQAIMNSRGVKARALLEKHGAKVGVGDAGSGLPELDAVPGKVTDYDIGQAGRESGRKLLDANEETFDREGRQPYKAATAQIDKGQGRNLVDVLPLRRKMLEVAAAPDTDPAVRSVLMGQVKEMDTQFPDTGMGKRFAPESWVNGKTSWLWKQAQPDKLASGAGTPRDAKFADVAAVGQEIREQGPYADANAKYRAAKQESGDFREALGAKRTPSADETIDERKIANFLSRRGQTTTTAGIQGGDKRLADLIAKHPELERTIDSPELLRAKADLQFRLKGPEHGGLIDRIGGPVAGTIAAAGTALAGHGGLGAAAAIPAYVIGQNATPIAGRLLARPAPHAINVGQSMQGAGALTSQFAAMQAAMDMKRQRDAAAIQTLFGKKAEEKRPGEVP